MRIEIGDCVKFLDTVANRSDKTAGLFAIVTATHPNMEFKVQLRENHSMPWQDLGDVGDDAPTYEFYTDTFAKSDGDDGAFIDFDTIGFIDFGNDDLWEVYTPRFWSNEGENPDGFVHNNFPVWLASHSEFDRWTALPDFLGQYVGSVHINEILMQLGALLTTYVNERTFPKMIHPTMPRTSKEAK